MEPYSKIGLTSESVTLRGDTNLNSLTKPNIKRDFLNILIKAKPGTKDQT